MVRDKTELTMTLPELEKALVGLLNRVKKLEARQEELDGLLLFLKLRKQGAKG